MATENKIEIKIGTPRERTTITQEGTFKQILEIRYTIGDASHLFTIDKIGATPEAIEAGIRKDAKKFVSITDKTISL